MVGAGYASAAVSKATQVGPYKGKPLAPQGGGGPYTCAIGQTKLVDNGDTDGSNGYSNATAAVFGFRRTLLDDFVVPAPGWVLDELTWRHIWSAGGSLIGTGVEVSIRADAGGTPGAVILTLSPTGYTEAATGRSWFGRPEMESHSNLGAAPLPPGTYWFEATIVGPDNNFWMIKNALTGNEVWCNYQDLGFGACSGVIGVGVTDTTFALCGSILPVELQDFSIE